MIVRYLYPSISLDKTLIHPTIYFPFIDHDFISHLASVKRKHKNKCILAYLNVNSYRYKHLQLNSIFKDMVVDVFAIAETKLNKNHCNRQFEKHNYEMYRRDRPLRANYGGGIVVYVNTNILCQGKSEYECENYDTIAVELHFGKRKCLCISIYRSTAYSLTSFLNETENILRFLYIF